MAITRVQKKANGGAGVASLTITLDAAPTSGNLLVATISYRADRTLTGAAGWTEAVDQQANVADVNHVDVAIWHKISDGSETATDWDLDVAGFLAGVVREYAGNVSVSPLDQTASTNDGGVGSSTPPTGTTPATTQADEVAVAIVGVVTGAPDAGPTWSNDFIDTVQQSHGATNEFYGADKILSATGAQSSVVTKTATTAYTSAIATFKASVVSGRRIMRSPRYGITRMASR